MVSKGNVRRWSWCLLKAKSLSNVADAALHTVRAKPRVPNPQGKSSGRPQTVRRKPADPGCGGGSRVAKASAKRKRS
eukprot:6429480-Prymnesium_polylepis.1